VTERDLPAGSPVVFIALALLAVILMPLWWVTLAFAPLPVFLAVKRGGLAQGGVVLIVVGAIAAYFMGWISIPIMLILFGLGYIPGLMGSAEQPGRRLAAAAVFLIVIFSAMAVSAYLSDRAETVKLVEEQATVFKQQVLAQAGSKANTPALRAEINKVTAVMPYILFAITAIVAIWLAWLNYYITGRFAKQWGFDWTPLPAFSHWRMHWVLAYGFIFGLIGTLFNERFEAYRQAIYGSGLVLLLVFGALYFLQGLAVIKYYADKLKFGPVARVCAYVLGVLIQMIFQGVSWLGLFDTWFDFRKLERAD
jgi:uncharacterized protein YybS (DUF2232 family)